jgi:hypothetical protein
MISWTFAGVEDVGFTEFIGCDPPEVKLQAAPVGSPAQVRATVWSNEPRAFTVNITGGELLGVFAVTDEGERVLKLKSTTCRVTGTSWVT